MRSAKLMDLTGLVALHRPIKVRKINARSLCRLLLVDITGLVAPHRPIKVSKINARSLCKRRTADAADAAGPISAIGWHWVWRWDLDRDRWSHGTIWQL